MENFYNYIRNFKLPKKSEIKSALASFSKKERKNCFCGVEVRELKEANFGHVM